MNFGFSDEQELLREQIHKLLNEVSPLAEVRRVIETPEREPPRIYRRLWGALGFPRLGG